MTPEQLAARWLADAPRINDPLYTSPTMREADALAAIARHLAPGDDLVSRLSRVCKNKEPLELVEVYACIALEAAARLSALTAQVAETQADRDKWFEGAGAHHVASMKQAQRADQAEAEVSRLRDRLARMEGALINLPAVYAHQINTGVREVYDPLQRFYVMESVLIAITEAQK